MWPGSVAGEKIMRGGAIINLQAISENACEIFF